MVYERSELLTLIAVPSAVRLGRLFAWTTVKRWGLDFMAEDAGYVAAELLDNAVRTTGIVTEYDWCHFAGVPLVATRIHVSRGALYIEVNDTSADPPLSKKGALKDRRAGFFAVAEGGKVVWCKVGDIRRMPGRHWNGRGSAQTAPIPLDLLERAPDGLGHL